MLPAVARAMRCESPSSVHCSRLPIRMNSTSVLSATSFIACQQLVTRAYASVNPTALVLTKLDELPQAGSIAALLRVTQRQRSFSQECRELPACGNSSSLVSTSAVG